MPNVPLSEGTQLRVDALFAEHERAAASELLVEKCGDNLPFDEGLGPVQLERIRFAVLKLFAGNLAELREAVTWANIDSRDVLVAAGFGNDVTAHRAWMPQRHDD
jgi:hypothetical protein